MTLQPAGNGRLLSEPDRLGQCPLPGRGGACSSCNGTLHAAHSQTGAQVWGDADDFDAHDSAHIFFRPQAHVGSQAPQRQHESGWEKAHVSQPPPSDSLLLNANLVALLVRTAFILLEFGSRPLRNAKKMLSCSLLCYWLYHYRFGADASILANRLDLSKLEPSSLILWQNTPFILILLGMKLLFKMAGLLSCFSKARGIKIPKSWKRLRIVKLLKLTKLAKCKHVLGLGLSLKSAKYLVKSLKYFKLLKVSRKYKKVLSKRHYKAFKIFKAFKVLKVLKLALVVVCLDSAVVPAWGSSGLAVCSWNV